jgi:hypothetical protein
MRRPLPRRPHAPPSPLPVPGEKRAIHGAVLLLNYRAFLGVPEAARWHVGQRPISLPALQPPMCGALGGLLRVAWEITPAAASDQDIEPRVTDLAKGGRQHATTPLRRLRRKQIGKELPRQVG